MRYLTLMTFVAISFASLSQDYWEALLNNNRKEALDLVEKANNDNPSIAALISKEIIREENGLFKTDPNFARNFAAYPESDYYLFPFWNSGFLFDDYIESDFHASSKRNVTYFSTNKTKIPGLNHALTYLKAVKERGENNFSSYKYIASKIPAIREWQFCGVFENLNNGGLDIPYGPETDPIGKEDFNANSNGYVNWYNRVTPQHDGYIFFNELNEYGAGVMYTQTFFSNETEREAVVRVGAGTKFKIWLDDQLILENHKAVVTDLDAYNVQINLPKGNHRLLVKVASRGRTYLLTRLTDIEGNELSGITFSNTYQDYDKPTLEKLDPRPINTPFETFFSQKLEANPDDFFSNLCLVKTYLRNQNYEEAKPILERYIEKYPESTFLRVLLMSVYTIEGDNDKSFEIRKNIERDDENSFIALSYRFADVQELFRLSVSEMDEFLSDYANSTDNEIIKLTTKVIGSLRQEDKLKTKMILNQLMDQAEKEERIGLVKIYIPLYESVLKDKARMMKQLEKFNKRYFDYGARVDLASKYSRAGKSDKAEKMLVENMENMDDDMDQIKKYVHYLQYHERFNESLPYIDKVLANFPYSLTGLESKGDALYQIGRRDEALEIYNKALIYNSANRSLRSKVRDLNGEENIVEKYKIDEMYAYIESNRGKDLDNNYGYNILLDEAVVELFEEAGGKSRYTYVYEVTSEDGIENLKEMNLGLSWDYNILKSEIVKKNGNLVPADTYGSNFVFAGLEIGDVIYIDYESSFSGYGRFYKDYTDIFQFDGYSPIVLSKYTLIVPDNINIESVYPEEGLEYELLDEEGYKTHVWKLENFKGFDQEQSFMPPMEDFAKSLYLSTIPNWDFIAQWYSDLVRPQCVENDVFNKTYNEIFEGVEVSELSEIERSRRIYNYIEDNVTYSHVSFRQGGHVPQKPSKTITSKLGDCKDLSLLYVLMARKAGLDANMVLVLTSDYGLNAMTLPSQEFNHCIAKVTIEGNEQFLELTNNYLPYGAFPRSLREASILEIPYEMKPEDHTELKLLSEGDFLRAKNKLKGTVLMTVEDEVQYLEIAQKAEGMSKSYFMGILEGDNYGMVTEEIERSLKRVLGDNVHLDTLTNIVNKKEDSFVSFESEATIDHKMQKIAGIKVLEIPYIFQSYTAGIIGDDERRHAIKYLDYETVDSYESSYEIKLTEGQKFLELPKDVHLTYKKHSYTQTYKLIAPDVLKVVVIAKPSGENITAEEYPEFKKYVKQVLETREELIGYK